MRKPKLKQNKNNVKEIIKHAKGGGRRVVCRKRSKIYGQIFEFLGDAEHVLGYLSFAKYKIDNKQTSSWSENSCWSSLNLPKRFYSPVLKFCRIKNPQTTKPKRLLKTIADLWFHQRGLIPD